MAETDIIDELLSLDDAALSEKMGLTEKLEELKENLKEAAKLSGKSREDVADRVERMFTPNVYPDEIKYAVDSAKRREAMKGKTTPASLASDCGCEIMEPYD